MIRSIADDMRTVCSAYRYSFTYQIHAHAGPSVRSGESRGAQLMLANNINASTAQVLTTSGCVGHMRYICESCLAELSSELERLIVRGVPTVAPVSADSSCDSCDGSAHVQGRA